VKSNLIFCSVIFPGPQAEIDNILLAESIRAFGGSFSNAPVWFFLPDYGKPLTDPARKRLEGLCVRVVPFDVDGEKLRFFFMGQLAGLAQAEAQAAGETDILAWLDSNTLLVNEPKEFVLPEGKALGYRPVHHLLLGSRFDQPLDPFWAQVYQSCRVPQERVFPMQPVVEDIQMRPYFNAGILVTRPEHRLFRDWYETFLDLYKSPVFKDFYAQDQRYIIFLHQAVLSGVVLRSMQQVDLLELPDTYNYPVHLFAQDATSRRPVSMDVLTTFRHEGFYQDADWMQRMPASDRLIGWLAEKLSELQ
jgi:hypothetical protein